jgi:hypothetical protein
MCDGVDCGKRKFVIESIVCIYIYIRIIISSATAARCRHDGRWVLGSEKNCELKASVRRKEECLSRPVCSTYKEVISPGVEFPSRARAHRFFFRSPYACLASIFFFFFGNFTNYSSPLSQASAKFFTFHPRVPAAAAVARLLQIQKIHPPLSRLLYLSTCI